MSLAKIIADCAAREGWEVYPSYSGRGMYGTTCLGVITDDEAEYVLGELIPEIVDEYDDDKKTMVWALSTLVNNRTDDMGLSTIIYWPYLDGEELEDEE